ncbi:hypothetical protein D3C87_1988150 [compost metagenome]
MIERFAANLGGFDKHLEIGARRRLPDKIVKRLWAQCAVGVFATQVSIDKRITVAHGSLLARSLSRDK